MAGLVPFTPINTNDRTLQLIQGELQRSISQLTNNPLLTGILKQVSFTAVDTDVVVPHYLGSTKVAWLAGSWNLPAIVFTSPNVGNSNQLILRCEQSSSVSAANTISRTNPLTGWVYPFMVQ
jgi:hypothetical protein